MPTDPAAITLPLLTLGLTPRVVGWLADAGLPSAAVETAAVRRGIGPAGPDRPLVLFDSRNASARSDADAAAALGYRTLDAGRLLSARGDGNGLDLPATAEPRRRFLDLLRPAVEEAGRSWLRIGDYPHPYRWAVCGDADDCDTLPGSVASAFGELPAPGTRGETVPARLPAADWLRTCAAAGRPVRVVGDAAAALKRIGAPRSLLPLVWTTTEAEFADWWRFRGSLGLRSVRRGRSYELDLTVPADATRFPIAVEIWRGRHVAVLPIGPGTTTLYDDAIPFQASVARHPAGFTADATDLDVTIVRAACAPPVRGQPVPV